MNKLIESLTIFSKYFDADQDYPTHCEHDTLMLKVANNDKVISYEDRMRLGDLGWYYSESNECWCSFYFGSC